MGSKYGDYMKLGGAYPHAFMTNNPGDGYIYVYYRTQHVCTYPISEDNSKTLTHIYLDGGQLEYYIKGTNVYLYNHETGETEVIVTGEL